MARWFDITPGAPYYCVVGAPISHSRSPDIHRQFANQSQIALRYERHEIRAGEFAEALSEFVSAGGRGMNVTVPLKQEAAAAVDSLSERARLAGAVNTIAVQADGHTYGDNTDGVGLVRDLTRNLRLTLANRRLLILGAGGAARGALPSLLEQAPYSVLVANRTPTKAHELAKAFRELGNIDACAYSEIEAQAFDLIVNATSLSLDGSLPPLDPQLISGGTWCYDMMYSASGRTGFTEWCDEHGAGGSSDGLGMLVEQAAESFFIWHEVEPDTAPVIRALRR